MGRRKSTCGRNGRCPAIFFLGEAKEDLRVCEKMKHVNGVGYTDRQSNKVSFRAMRRHPDAAEAVRAWLECTDYDAAIWIALAPIFRTRGASPSQLMRR